MAKKNKKSIEEENNFFLDFLTLSGIIAWSIIIGFVIVLSLWVFVAGIHSLTSHDDSWSNYNKSEENYINYESCLLRNPGHALICTNE